MANFGRTSNDWQHFCDVLEGFGVDVTSINDNEVAQLWNGGYRTRRRLEVATREGLTATGVPHGLVDEILSRQGTAQRAATLPEAEEMRLALKEIRFTLKESRKIQKHKDNLLYASAFPPRSTASRSGRYLSKALQHYFDNSEQKPTRLCFVSGRNLPSGVVKTGHIYQQRWPLVDNLGFLHDDPCNILFMHEKIEAYYDNLRFTVLPVLLTVFLLDKSIEDNVVFMDATKEVKWKDLHGRPLTLPANGQPSQTALNFHARRAFKHAVSEQWCTDGELPSLSYGDHELLLKYLSDSSSSGAAVSAENLGGPDESGVEGYIASVRSCTDG